MRSKLLGIVVARHNALRVVYEGSLEEFAAEIASFLESEAELARSILPTRHQAVEFEIIGPCSSFKARGKEFEGLATQEQVTAVKKSNIA